MSKKRKSGARQHKQQHARQQQTASPEDQAESASRFTPEQDPVAITEHEVDQHTADSSVHMNTPADTPVRTQREEQALELGRQLRQAREQLGMDLDEAAHRMRLPWRVIAKLESGNWRGIDSPIYLHGYLRSYTSLLGMPVPDLVEDVGNEVATPQPLVSTGGISHGRYLMQRYAVAGTYLVITALIVVPVIILGINGGLKHNLARLAPLDPAPLAQPADQTTTSRSAGATSATTAAEIEQKPLMASMAPVNLIDQGPSDTTELETPVREETQETQSAHPTPKSDALSIKLSAPSWVEVTSTSGDRLAYSLLEAGTHVYKGEGTLTIRLGNAGAAEVSMDGRKLDLGAYRHANVAYFKVDAKGALHDPPDA